MVWTALDLLALSKIRRRARPADGLCRAGRAGSGGAAGVGRSDGGLRAGRVTNEWPLMNGSFWPGASQNGESLGHALTADPAIVHFIHRWWAWAWWRCW
jgi:cytochrome c oxidase assembly protein subunit 15